VTKPRCWLHASRAAASVRWSQVRVIADTVALCKGEYAHGSRMSALSSFDNTCKNSSLESLI
jgi:hypothetical protein